MPNERFFLQAMQTGSTLITAVIIVFFLVLAFRKDSITYPTLFKWAVGCLSVALMLPMITIFYSAFSQWTSAGIRSIPDAGDAKNTLLVISTMVSPLMFFTSIVLGLFAMLPVPYYLADARRTTKQPGGSGSPSTETPKPHPLD